MPREKLDEFLAGLDAVAARTAASARPPRLGYRVDGPSCERQILMYRPMQGVRVLEVAQFTFVPAAGAVLADWGADVIKVEPAEAGGAQRGLGLTDDELIALKIAGTVT